MPQIRKYASDADRVAAWRERKRQAEAEAERIERARQQRQREREATERREVEGQLDAVIEAWYRETRPMLTEYQRDHVKRLRRDLTRSY